MTVQTIPTTIILVDEIVGAVGAVEHFLQSRFGAKLKEYLSVLEENCLLKYEEGEHEYKTNRERDQIHESISTHG